MCPVWYINTDKREDGVVKMFIGVAAHKRYEMPEQEIYHAIQVGSDLHEKISGYRQDNQGENISSRNSNYSELTALYYLWKSVHSDVKGLVHYRRLLASNSNRKKILEANEINATIASGKIIIPKKRHYYIETNYTHYAHAHNKEDLDETRNVINDKYPEYLIDFDNVMGKTSAHMFNMFIMDSRNFDSYCKWLFDILFELENRIDITEYSVQEARVFGYISELLLDVWISKNNVEFGETNVIYVEGQHIFRKIFAFLQRKFLGTGSTHISSKID